MLIVTIILLEGYRRDAYKRWAFVSVGVPEAVVRERLGEPVLRFDNSASGTDYYVPGFSRRVRPIIGRLFVYQARDLVLYVWFDTAGKVEDVYIGASR